MSVRMRSRWVIIAAVAIALVVATAACTGRSDGGASAQPQLAPAPVSAGAAGGQAAANPIPDIVRRVQPSVVTIFTSQGLGSGVIWSRNGIVVTDAHVVAGATQVQIAFADGRRVNGTVKASDEVTDLAVVQADRQDLPPATFQPRLPVVGDLAVAIGSPLGFENTVTSGIISGLHRQIPGSAQQSQSLVDLIQTDAAISPGNSGGALVNGAGQVVGINEAYIPPSQGAVSIGFATPAATVVNVVQQLLRQGRAQHAFIGIQPGELTPEIAQQLGVSQTQGVVVMDVVDNGPAAKAGLRPGDVIVAVDSKQVATVEDFLAVLRPHKPGDTVTVTFLRGDASQSTDVTLADRPPSG
jgi:serine protease DegQ